MAEPTNQPEQTDANLLIERQRQWMQSVGWTHVEWSNELGRAHDALLALEARLVAAETQLEQVARALDAIHSEASRWIIMDAWPAGADEPEDWARMAKARAEWIAEKTEAALAGLAADRQEPHA